MKTVKFCKGKCRKFQIQNQHKTKHGMCFVCNIWIEQNMCHLEDESKTADDSTIWLCNCCNGIIYRYLRKIKPESKHQSNPKNHNYESQIDLSYLSKQRAIIIKKIAKCIFEKHDNPVNKFEDMLTREKITVTDIQIEFNVTIDEILRFAQTMNPPNKISLIIEFERIREIIGKTPTKQDIDKYSEINLSYYDTEFESWEYMLDKLGYDPWYRNKSSSKIAHNTSDSVKSINESTEYEQQISDDPNTKINIERTQSWLRQYYRQLDSEQNYVDYSHEKMFELLKDYLNLLPRNSKYKDIFNLF